MCCAMQDWAEEVQSRETEAAGRYAPCRAQRPARNTIDDEEDWTCDDAPENWFAGASNTSEAPRLSRRSRVPTGMPYCPCQRTGRGVDQTRDDGVIVRHCSIAACARRCTPTPRRLPRKSMSPCTRRESHAYDKDNEEKGRAFKGATSRRGKTGQLQSPPETILLCCAGTARTRRISLCRFGCYPEWKVELLRGLRTEPGARAACAPNGDARDDAVWRVRRGPRRNAVLQILPRRMRGGKNTPKAVRSSAPRRLGNYYVYSVVDGAAAAAPRQLGIPLERRRNRRGRVRASGRCSTTNPCLRVGGAGRLFPLVASPRK